MNSVLEIDVLQDVAEIRTNPGFKELNAFYFDQGLQFDRYGNLIFLDTEEMNQLNTFDEKMNPVAHTPGDRARISA